MLHMILLWSEDWQAPPPSSSAWRSHPTGAVCVLMPYAVLAVVRNLRSRPHTGMARVGTTSGVGLGHSPASFLLPLCIARRGQYLYRTIGKRRLKRTVTF